MQYTYVQFKHYPEVSNLLANHLWEAVAQGLPHILYYHVFLQIMKSKSVLWTRDNFTSKRIQNGNMSKKVLALMGMEVSFLDSIAFL